MGLFDINATLEKPKILEAIKKGADHDISQPEAIAGILHVISHLFKLFKMIY